MLYKLKIKVIINLYKVFIFFILFISSLISKSQISNGLRVGGGLGESIYWGSQMDDKISFSTYDKSEANLGLNIQFYKALDNKNEIGIRYLNTELWSFKTSNMQAINAKINEFAVVYQRSLNGNSDLYSNKLKFTHNLVLGLSFIFFKSRAYSIDPSTKVFKTFSSIGNGVEIDPLVLTRPDSQLALGGVFGYNLGFRLSNSFSIYLENTFTLSASNYLHGNLLTKTKLTNNGYTYNALTLYINLNPNGNRLGCPKIPL